MERWLWMLVIVAIFFSLIGSVGIVAYVTKKGQERDAEFGISRTKINASHSKQGRKWNRIISIYLVICVIFIAIILYQSIDETNREVFDCLAVPAGAIFFIIQAFSTRNTEIRRERATVCTSAIFIMLEVGVSSESGRRSYHSIFEFSVNEITYRVRYTGKPNKEKGEQIELYYDPDNPSLVYIPEMEKPKGRIFSAILFGYGVIFPLIALLAPLFR